MSDFSTNLFESIDSLVARRIDSTPIDLTITGSVTLLVNVAVGEYKITYQGDTFSAFSLDPMTVYKKGDSVYILVPKGDFSSKKIILGKAAFNDKVSYADRQGMQNQWRTRGPNWLSPEWYWKTSEGGFRSDSRDAGIVVTTKGEEDLIVHPDANWRDYIFYREYDGEGNLIPEANEQSYTPIRREKTLLPDNSHRPDTEVIGRATLERVDSEFQMYGNQLDYIMIQANFETMFSSAHTSGEYGVLVECYEDNPHFGIDGYHNADRYILTQYQLSFGDFNGSRYSYAQPTPQQAVFPIARGSLKGLVRVSLYQTDGWQTDVVPAYTANGITFDPELGAEPVTSRNNIEATDIAIYWCEPINLDQKLFWIKVDAIRGTGLFNTEGHDSSWITELQLKARLMYGGEDITSRETCKFVWFRQKYSALRDLAEGTEVDRFGNTWASYLPEGENGWAPVHLMVKSPEEEPFFGENANYRLGLMENATFYEDEDFHEALEIPIEDVPWQWRYLVVCYYNPSGGTLEEIQRSNHNDALIWEYETVRNLSSIHDFELPMASIGEDLEKIYLRVRNNSLPWEEGVYHDIFHKDDADPTRDWWCRWWWQHGTAYNAMQDDNFPRFIKGKRRIDKYLLNEPITFKAQIYGKRLPTGASKEEQVADAAQPLFSPPIPASESPDMNEEYHSYEIANIERAIIPDNNAAVHVSFIGTREHHYNANGSIRLSDSANTQHNVRAIITPRDDSIVVFSTEWLAPDGTPLREQSPEDAISGDAYTPAPQNSMLHSMWMSDPAHLRALHYKVEEKYDWDRANDISANTFILRIRFLNGVVHDEPCEITFHTASSNGSQGSEWKAEILPVNATPTLDGGNAISKTPWTNMIKDHPRPLVVDGYFIEDEDGQPQGAYQRNDDYRLFLRPFVSRNGVLLEDLNESSKYTYKIFWDVRFPSVKNVVSPRNTAKFGSFLELSHDGISGRDYDTLGSDGGTPYQRGPTWPDIDIDPNAKRLQAYTHSRDREGRPYTGDDSPTNEQPTFGAIEVRWANRATVNGITMAQLNYAFIVRAQIDIFYNGEKVATTFSYHGTDVVFTNGTPLTFNKENPDNPNVFIPSLVKTNWPLEVLYTSTGVAPEVTSKILTFYYGNKEDVDGPLLTATPVNLTPVIQELNIDDKGLRIRGPYSPTETYTRDEESDGLRDVVTYGGKFFAVREVGDICGIAPDLSTTQDPNWYQISDLTAWRLLPRAFYFFENMDNGALATDILNNTGQWPEGATYNPDFKTWRNATFVRPIVYRISAYGNDHINGWDGKSIDLNEENGTIFAPTIGAGWKHPFTNTFSGVLMGVDISQKKQDYQRNYGGFSLEDIKMNPYMTGLYGYQDGASSFGIMENGTAFFGRADRGGRIIIDGFNAQIYGGTTQENDTSLGANMRNRMRLNFIDFGGAAATKQSMADPSFLHGGIQNPPVGRPSDAPATQELFPTEGLEVDDMPGIEMGSLEVELTQDFVLTPAANRWFGNFREYFAPGKGRSNTLDPVTQEPYPGEDPLAFYYGGFASGHGFSTPAIEIGSYEDWVRDSNGRRIPETRVERQIVLDANDPERTRHPWRAGKQLVREYTVEQIRHLGQTNNLQLLEIPGFRRFLVTYDGTLYAMNAFIMGTIMGSNIIGSRFFTDSGKGVLTNNIFAFGDDGPDTMAVMDTSGDWSNLVPRTKLQAPSLVFDHLEGTLTEFRQGGRGSARHGNGYVFAVGTDGTVVADRMHITGGSISIGTFHVIGANKGDLKKGDVFSFGKMHLIGRLDNSGMPIIGSDTALEAWGDLYLRGKLTNLGPVYLGATPDKATSGRYLATSRNSPFSVLPGSFSVGGLYELPEFPVKIGVWPLYFHMTTEALNHTTNGAWVTLSSQTENTQPGPGTYNGGSYMPVFSWRPADQRNITGTGTDQLGNHVVWRLDQIGMWTDGMFFTRKSWTSNQIPDNSPMSLTSHGLAYMGWMRHGEGVQGATPKWAFTIKNMNRNASSIVVEAPSAIRLTSGRDQPLRGTSVEAYEGISKVLLETRGLGSAGRRRATIMLDGTTTADTASMSANSIILSGKRQNRTTGTAPNDLEAFISINALRWEGASEITDELGVPFELIPARSPAGDGRIWIKAKHVAIDGAATIGTGDRGVATNLNNSTFRLNRSPDGSGSDWGTTPSTPSWSPDGSKGTAYIGGNDGVVISGGHFWIRSIAPENQHGIYARYA